MMYATVVSWVRSLPAAENKSAGLPPLCSRVFGPMARAGPMARYLDSRGPGHALIARPSCAKGVHRVGGSGNGPKDCALRALGAVSGSICDGRRVDLQIAIILAMGNGQFGESTGDLHK